jgi:hypothetical protein
MARYTLKTYCGSKLTEVFEHRNVGKLQSILVHPRHNRAGETDAWGTPLPHVDRFEIFDSMREKLFSGNINDALTFSKTLR